MIKQQEKVIKKGEYYEMETYEETMMLISKTKKEQSQQNSTSNIPISEHILTQIPNWIDARNNYFCTGFTKEFSNKGLDQLMQELSKMAKLQHSLRDEDRNQIQMLMEEIGSFANCPQIQLNHLPNKPQESAKSIQSQHTSINFKAKYNLRKISDRIQKLEALEFPELIALEHQLEIMLGEKKPLQSLELSQMDEKEKEELNNLYNHLNSLSIMNNTQRVIDSVFMNEAKHIQMESWLDKMQKVQALNADLLVELKQDQEIVNKLSRNFSENVNKVKQILSEIKNQK